MVDAGQQEGPSTAAAGALPATWVADASPVLKEPHLCGGRLFWLEQLPAERGRTTLRLRLGEGQELDLTPGLDLRSRIHGYGGGTFAVAGDIAVVVAEGGRSLWRLDLAGLATGRRESEGTRSAATPPPPLRLTPEPASGCGDASGQPALFADGVIDLGRQRWIGVCEENGRDRLVSVPLAGGAPRLLWESPDFCGYAVLSPGGGHLAWVSWQQPCMPWDRSTLWLGRFDGGGELVEIRSVAGSSPGEEPAISVFQPIWAGDDLVVANDRSGWWNLECLPAACVGDPGRPLGWRALLPMQAEFAMPQWVYGMRTTAWDGQQLVASACLQGRWQLGALGTGPAAEPPGAGLAACTESGAVEWRPISLPFDDLAALTAEQGRMVAVASGPTQGPGLLEVDIGSGSHSHRPAAPGRLPAAVISRAEVLWFAGHAGRRTHAWYYPPRGDTGTAAPLLIRGHSGPTAMARTGLSLQIQYWTSRGWGVVDVNYGGSTGFGRAYRERLDGGWGVVDVDDCLAAARALVAGGRADPGRIAMEGSSASGFTVLAAMAREATIRAGACRYPVTDLTALAEGDHRFEARYFDALVGPWPAARRLYEERSPLQQVDRINAPLILFHGSDDPVVPAAQTVAMVERLRQRGVSVELHLFEGEGHGFRDAAVQRQVLERTEAFFRRQFALRERS